MIENQWSGYSKKYLRHPKNPEFVTGRVNIVNQRNVIRISIGKIICDLLQFKKSDRTSVYVHKEDKNYLLISKTLDPHSYKLHETTCLNKKSNFLAVTFRYDFHEPFRLSQTIILDFDIEDHNLLCVNLEKLKWRE